MPEPLRPPPWPDAVPGHRIHAAKVESLTMSVFTRDDVAELYAQHTHDTGQAFEPDAIDRAFELTCGQPWLVNAIAAQCVDRLQPDRSQPITKELIDIAGPAATRSRLETARSPAGREITVVRA